MKKPGNQSIHMIFVMMLILLSACSSVPKQGQPEKISQADYRQGTDYKIIASPLVVEKTDGQIKVVEVFFYACPHCNVLESKIQSWLKNKQSFVNFQRMPAILGPSWVEQARAYYVAEQLRIIDKIHPALLRAIHQHKKQFYNKYSVMTFFLEQGVSKQQFLEAYYSPAVADKLNQARIMTVKFGLRGVPAMIVNDKYKTAQFYTGSQEKMLKVVDYLIAKERMLAEQ